MTQKEISGTAAPQDDAAEITAQKVATKAPPGNRKPATIGSSIVIHGDVAGEEDLVVDGTIEGTVNFKDNNLVVSVNGRVTANINARIIRVDGEVKGELHGSEQVVISPSGKVKGDIRAPRVVLEDGCSFKGSVDMETDKAGGLTARQHPACARALDARSARGVNHQNLGLCATKRKTAAFAAVSLPLLMWQDQR